MPSTTTSHYRPLKDGSRYNKLFPRANGGTETIKRNASLSDTIDLLPQVVQRFNWQTAQLSQTLKGRTLTATCRNIWEFCYHHFQYKEDQSGKEQIRSPARAWQDRISGIDCDCFSVLISCILTNLGILHSMRIAKYNDDQDPDPPFKHIYVIVHSGGNYITIDPVLAAFDFEAPYIETRDLKMELQILNGPPNIDQQDLFLGGLPPAGSPKFDRVQQEAAAKGMTMEQYQAWQREEFIRKNGVTPEQWAAGVQNQIATQTAASTAAYNAETEKVKAELRKRGVSFPPNATRDQLLELLRQNPAPSAGGQAANAINHLNPVTALLRSGVLLCLKLNLFGVAAKLRWALVSQAIATSRGMTATDYNKTKATYQKLRDIFYKAGGKAENFNQAILTGKGNTTNPIGTGSQAGGGGSVAGGIEGLLGVSIYHDEYLSRSNAINGLGEPVSATAAIAAATAAMTAIAAILKSVKAPKGAAEGTVPTDSGLTFDESGIEAGLENDTGSGGDNGDDDSGDGKGKGIVGWVKENPLPTAGIAIAAIGGGYFVIKALAPKKQTLAGPKRTTTPKKTVPRKTPARKKPVGRLKVNPIR